MFPSSLGYASFPLFATSVAVTSFHSLTRGGGDHAGDRGGSKPAFLRMR